ncbi:hypothetical protein AALA90_00125 [Lachnospiraceae bacterium 38-10]
MHIADLLYPCEGIMTYYQCIISSRDLYLRGNERWAKLSREEDQKTAKNAFDKLITSINEYGLNPYYGMIGGTLGKTFISVAGTHRLAYAFNKDGNAYIMIQLIEYKNMDKILDGKNFMKNILISSEIEELERNYNKIMSRIRTEISGFINRNYWESAKEFIEKYGDLADVKCVEKEIQNKTETNQWGKSVIL